MDYSFEDQFDVEDVIKSEIDTVRVLQDVQSYLQESLSESDQLLKLIDGIFQCVKEEHADLASLLKEIPKPILRNVALPENPLTISASEKAGYSVYYIQFLAFSLHKMTEQYHSMKDHCDSLKKAINQSPKDIVVVRTGEIKLPKLESGSIKSKPIVPEKTKQKESKNGKK